MFSVNRVLFSMIRSVICLNGVVVGVHEDLFIVSRNAFYVNDDEKACVGSTGPISFRIYINEIDSIGSVSILARAIRRLIKARFDQLRFTVMLASPQNFRDALVDLLVAQAVWAVILGCRAIGCRPKDLHSCIATAARSSTQGLQNPSTPVDLGCDALAEMDDVLIDIPRSWR